MKTNITQVEYNGTVFDEQFIREMGLEKSDNLKSLLVSTNKVLRQEKQEADKQAEKVRKEEAEKFNRANVKLGSTVETTYHDEPAIGRVVNMTDKSVTVEILNEDGTVKLTEAGKPAKPWKRYFAITLIDQNDEDQEEDDE